MDPTQCSLYANTEFAMGGNIVGAQQNTFSPLLEFRMGATRTFRHKYGIGGLLSLSGGGGQGMIASLGPRFSTFSYYKKRIFEIYFTPSYIFHSFFEENFSHGLSLEIGLFQNNINGIFIRQTRIPHGNQNKDLFLLGIQTRGKKALWMGSICAIVVPVIIGIAISGSN